MGRFIELFTDEPDGLWTVNVEDISAYSTDGTILLRNGITLKVNEDEITDLHGYLYNRKKVIHYDECLEEDE